MEKLTSSVKPKRIPGAMSHHERACWCDNSLICGVDEVGRGCLAGPVVTAAVILQPGQKFCLLKDSKILTAHERARAAKWIVQHSWFAYGIVSHYHIDQLNIYQATLCAMRRAVAHCVCRAPNVPKKIIVDALPLSFSDSVLGDIDVEFFPFAEQQSISVAAASILAKIKRDELMNYYENLFPGYLLGEHKGYATKLHRERVCALGESIIHRKSFLNNKLLWGEEQHEERQISLFCRSS